MIDLLELAKKAGACKDGFEMIYFRSVEDKNVLFLYFKSYTKKIINNYINKTGQITSRNTTNNW